MISLARHLPGGGNTHSKWSALKWPPGFCFKRLLFFLFCLSFIHQKTFHFTLFYWTLTAFTSVRAYGNYLLHVCIFHHMQIPASAAGSEAADKNSDSLSNSFFFSSPPPRLSFKLPGGWWRAGPRPPAGQRLLTDNGFPLWVSCGQGNKRAVKTWIGQAITGC